MVFNKNKRGQAAIEFLMTYGWMLLVVLIVGALIFSFVDFGSLLPNKVELSNNLRADQTQSSAFANSNGYAVVVFTYSGTKITIDPSDASSTIQEGLGAGNCNLIAVKNSDTGSYSGDAGATLNSGLDGSGTDIGDDTAVPFLSGHTGILEYDCSGLSPNLVAEDTLEGKVTVNFQNPKVGLPTPSSGSIRLVVQE